MSFSVVVGDSGIDIFFIVTDDLKVSSNCKPPRAVVVVCSAFVHVRLLSSACAFDALLQLGAIHCLLCASFCDESPKLVAAAQL